MNNQNPSQQEILDGFKRAVSEIWARDGQNTWPIEINSILHLFMGVFFDEFRTDKAQLNEKGLNQQTFAAFLRTSSRIIRLIMPCVLGMKHIRIPLDQQRRHVMELLSLVKHLKYGDLFNRDGKNIVLSPHAFEHSIRQSHMIPADKKSSSMVHRLCGILWTYAEALCFKVHGLIREFHGPYQFSDKDEEILIRDFTCLNPVELWEECRTVQYNNIRVVTAYENLDMTIDIYNNVSIKEGASCIDRLKAYYVEADGNLLDPEQIDRLSTVLSQTMMAIAFKIDQLDWRQLAEKYAEIFWFGKKELRDQLQLDWRPPHIVKKQIRSGSLNTRLQNMSPGNVQRLLKVAF